ncbi:hypothetical protein TNCV_5081131 [Trichonephila clavipes]|nr:hypothetical protein TNCV_5081131 [Trichonephila clavipes]
MLVRRDVHSPSLEESILNFVADRLESSTRAVAHHNVECRPANVHALCHTLFMSLCGMELLDCGTCCVILERSVLAVSRPMMYHTCSNGDKSCHLAGQGNMSTLCRVRYVSTVV